MTDARQGLRSPAVAMLLIWLALIPGFVSVIAARKDQQVSLVLVPALFALAFAVPAIGRGLVNLLLRPSRLAYVAGVAAISAAITSWFVVGPLGKQTLGLDPSVYLQEARALSHLRFGLPAGPSFLAFGGRFLFEGPDGALYGVFPPGYPLFLVPFVKLGAPLLSGPVLAALLVLAQHWLGRLVLDDELAERVSLLLPIVAFARAIETADLLSHAFTCLLATAAVAAAISVWRGSTRPALLSAIAVGCSAWAVTARILDGLVIAAFVGAILVHAALTRGVARGAVAVGLVAALPFAALLLGQQKAATGDYFKPTQAVYFERSDYPQTCHRLGLGIDVGCSVEHWEDREANGADGYTLDDATRIVRSRALVFGADLLGFSPLLLLCFVAGLRHPSPGVLLCGAFVVALTIAYGLFYYGNAPAYGARHLFPAMTFAYLAVGKALVCLDDSCERGSRGELRAGALLFSMLIVSALNQNGRFRDAAFRMAEAQRGRPDLRPIIARKGLQQGIVLVDDTYQYLAAFDPIEDGPNRLLVNDDYAGMTELRRARPELPVYVAKPFGRITRVELEPPEGLSIEIETAWPSFVRHDGVASKRVYTPTQLKMSSSGDSVLGVFMAHEGASLTVPFPVAKAGRYAFALDVVRGPDFGIYEAFIDGKPIARWDGGAEGVSIDRTPESEPLEVSQGRHDLVVRCVGKAPRSTGYKTGLDRLVGRLVP